MIRRSRLSVLYLAPSGNFDAPYFHRANAFISALSKNSFSQIIEIGPPKCLKDLFPPVKRLSNPRRIKIVSPFWVNLPQISRLDTFIFAMIRAMLLNIWAGTIARLFLNGRNFRALLFYSPSFAFFQRFLGRDILWAYDKADAYSFFYRGAVGDVITLLDRYDTTHADIVLASSHQLEVLARREGAKRTTRVDNGIYGRDFRAHPPRDKMLAVYVGNLVQDIWGVDMFLRAVPKIAKDFPSFHVNIVGEGPLKKEYESVCARLGISDRTRFEGYAPHDKISNAIGSARVAVAPYKSFPGFRFSSSLKILEYLASGTPVVVSDVGPFADLIQTNRVGLVVDPTPEKIGEGICSILREDDEKWEAMSKRAVNVACKYEWDAVLSKAFDEIEKACASVANDNKGPDKQYHHYRGGRARECPYARQQRR